MVVIELDNITNKENFQEHIFKELEKVGIIIDCTIYAWEGGFKHSTKIKPEFRFTGVYNLNNDTYKLFGLCSKRCEYYQEEWTPEEVEAIKRAVQSYSIG